MVASTSSTIVDPRSRPAHADAGTPPGTCDHTCRRARARATWIFARLPTVTSSRVRHTVAAEATGPRTPDWWRRTPISEMDSPPSARITATSVRTRPRSWTGIKRRRAIAPESSAVSPTRSARRRGARAPPWEITPTPPAVTDRPDDHEVRFTYQVPSAGQHGSLDKNQLPLFRKHFGLFSPRDPQIPVNHRG